MYNRAIPIPGNEKKNDDAPLYDDAKDGCNDIDLSETEEEIIVKR